MPLNVLITGETGMLGSYLSEALGRSTQVTGTSLSGGDRPCDLTGQEDVAALVSSMSPDVIIHAAALTDVDQCESEPDRAFALNRDTGANLIAALSPKAKMIYISTDQVYPDTPGPHSEENTSPVNVYGRSKLEGENAVLEHPRSLVLRTNFFGPSRRVGKESLSDFFIRKFSQGEFVTLFKDVSFSPLHMATLAALVEELAHCDLTGVFNAGCNEGATKAEFATAVARHRGLDSANAETAFSSALPGRAPRPRDLRLDVSHIEHALGRAMPTMAEEIAKL